MGRTGRVEVWKGKIEVEVLKISEKFNLEDIRAIRDYNSARHAQMTRTEIITEEKTAAANFLKEMQDLRKSEA